MQYIADKLKRSDAKDCKGHASWYPCEYCFAKGTKIEISDSKAKKKLEEQKKLIEEKITQCQSEGTPASQSRIDSLVSLKEELQKSINSLKKNQTSYGLLLQ